MPEPPQVSVPDSGLRHKLSSGFRVKSTPMLAVRITSIAWKRRLLKRQTEDLRTTKDGIISYCRLCVPVSARGGALKEATKMKERPNRKGQRVVEK